MNVKPKEAAAETNPSAPREGQKREFKKSIFVWPGSGTPGKPQMLEIAKSLAALMNAEGGDLFVGVADNGSVSGMGGDLAILVNQTSLVAVSSPRYTDKDLSYKATADHFELKIRAIVRAYLSANASKYLDKTAIVNENGKLVCDIRVKPCAPEDFVYFYDFNEMDRTEVEEIYVRYGNQKRKLRGQARDEFVRSRVTAGFKTQFALLKDEMASSTGTHGYEDFKAMLEDFQKNLEAKHISGQDITVSGGLPFTEEAVMAADKPKSLAWEGSHYVDVKDWRDLILKVLEKLQEIDAEKFDELAEQKGFSKTLIKVVKPREKHGDCFSTRFGAEGKIRIKSSLGNRTYLWQEDKPLRKIIAAFGVDVSKFMFVAK